MINRNSIFYWLRWILLLPLSFGGGLLLSLGVEIILTYFVVDTSLELFKLAISRLIMSFLSVILAVIIAPKYKSRAVLIICSIWLIAILFGMVLTTTGIKLYGQQYEIKDGGLAITMVICGLASGCYLIWKRQGQPIVQQES